jgi:hypothetical protein
MQAIENTSSATFFARKPNGCVPGEARLVDGDQQSLGMVKDHGEAFSQGARATGFLRSRLYAAMPIVQLL